MINSDVKLIAIHDKLDKKINNLKLKHGVDGAKGSTGPQGATGLKGPQGPDGSKGPEGSKGTDGAKGPKGEQGDQGVSISDASVDLDGNLVIKLSDGNEIDAGAALGGGLGNNNKPLYATGSTTKIIDPSAKFKNPVMTFYGAGTVMEGNLERIEYFDSNGTQTAEKSFRYSAETSLLTRVIVRIINGEASRRNITYSEVGSLTRIADSKII